MRIKRKAHQKKNESIEKVASLIKKSYEQRMRQNKFDKISIAIGIFGAGLGLVIGQSSFEKNEIGLVVLGAGVAFVSAGYLLKAIISYYLGQDPALLEAKKIVDDQLSDTNLVVL